MSKSLSRTTAEALGPIVVPLAAGAVQGRRGPVLFPAMGRLGPGFGPDGRTAAAADGTVMLRLGKKAAGRLFDGAIWDGFPKGMVA